MYICFIVIWHRAKKKICIFCIVLPFSLSKITNWKKISWALSFGTLRLLWRKNPKCFEIMQKIRDELALRWGKKFKKISKIMRYYAKLCDDTICCESHNLPAPSWGRKTEDSGWQRLHDSCFDWLTHPKMKAPPPLEGTI